MCFIKHLGTTTDGFIWGGGGMHGFIWGACMVLFGGACMVLLGGHVWFNWGGVVLFGGVHGFIQGGHAWFYSGGGGMRGFFSFFGYNEIRSMSWRYASYWNAFLYKIFFTTVFQFQCKPLSFPLLALLSYISWAFVREREKLMTFSKIWDDISFKGF